MDNQIRNHLLMLAQARDGHVGGAMIGGKRGVPNITVADLKKLCKMHKIKGYSKLKKSELIALLRKKKVQISGYPNGRRVPHKKAKKGSALVGGARKKRVVRKMVRKGVKRVAKKSVKSPWIAYVKKVQAQMGISYRDALKEASKSYNK